MAKDISAVGATVAFSGGISCIISEFSDEGTPFDCPDVDVSTNAKNLNGEMISSRTPSVYSFSVTVIPGTVADHVLQNALRRSAIQPGNNKIGDVQYSRCTITIPAGVQSGNSGSAGAGSVFGGKTVVTYTNVRIKSGPTGPSTSAEGRLAARTYTFEAEGFTAA